MDADDRCDALARRIADLAPEWAQPGSASRDPRTDLPWRRTLDRWVPEQTAATRWTSRWPPIAIAVAWMQDVDADDTSATGSVARAIAAGPDWRDDATLGALLLGLGAEVSVAVVHDDGRPIGWYVSAYDASARPAARSPVCATRAEAILAAVVQRDQDVVDVP